VAVVTAGQRLRTLLERLGLGDPAAAPRTLPISAAVRRGSLNSPIGRRQPPARLPSSAHPRARDPVAPAAPGSSGRTLLFSCSLPPFESSCWSPPPRPPAPPSCFRPRRKLSPPAGRARSTRQGLLERLSAPHAGADGEFSSGTRVVLMVYDGGEYCRVVDARGLYVETCPGQKGTTSWQSVRVGSENVRAGTDSCADTGCGADDGIDRPVEADDRVGAGRRRSRTVRPRAGSGDEARRPRGR
jgi:hypothetical protein